LHSFILSTYELKPSAAAAAEEGEDISAVLFGRGAATPKSLNKLKVGSWIIHEESPPPKKVANKT
jgi:hypothetical protein